MKRYSLYTIIFVIFLFLIVVSFLFISFATTRHRQDLIETAIREKIHLAETINETMTSPVWIYRLALVPGMEKSFINEMAKFEDVRYIRVVNSDGTIYKSSIEGEWGKIIKDVDISKVIRSRKKIIKDQTFQGEKIKLIIYPGYQDKTVWVAFTLRSIEASIEKMWTRDVLTSLSILLFYLCFLLIILRSIINPLKEMTLACERVRKGNLDTEINIKSKTEIGELATTFNKMLKDLKKSHTALEEIKTVLEIKVAARTRELRELAEQREEIIKQRTKELRGKIEELERFQKLAVGRELRMIELKEEIKKLEEELEKYKSAQILSGKGRK